MAIDEKTQAKLDKAVAAATKNEAKRILAILKAHKESEWYHQLDLGTAKKAVAESLKTITAEIKAPF